MHGNTCLRVSGKSGCKCRPSAPKALCHVSAIKSEKSQLYWYLQAAQKVVVLGGTLHSLHALLGHYKHMPADKLLHVTTSDFLQRYDQLYRCG